MPDVGAAGVEPLGLGRVDIIADDAIPGAGDRERKRQAHIAEADHRNRRTPLGDPRYQRREGRIGGAGSGPDLFLHRNRHPVASDHGFSGKCPDKSMGASPTPLFNAGGRTEIWRSRLCRAAVLGISPQSFALETILAFWEQLARLRPNFRRAAAPRAAGEEPRLAIVTCIKNEGEDLVEWLCFHRHIGVSEFVIYDNLSTDATSRILAGVPFRDTIKVHRVREEAAQKVGLRRRHQALSPSSRLGGLHRRRRIHRPARREDDR